MSAIKEMTMLSAQTPGAVSLAWGLPSFRTPAYIRNPEQVEVAMCREDELDQRRGLRSELDELWSVVKAKANPFLRESHDRGLSS